MFSRDFVQKGSKNLAHVVCGKEQVGLLQSITGDYLAFYFAKYELLFLFRK